jgi:glycosyltransferase involved in cell wall biosynthesis
MYKKLVIISHTEHYYDSKNQIIGLESTVNEINFLADYWQEIVHVACLHDSKPSKNSIHYSKSNIKFVPISPFGGKKSIDKLKIFFKIPSIIRQVLKSINGASEVQLRLPTSIGLFLLPLFSIFISRKFTFWTKYAGDWNQLSPPISNSIQRWWLKRNFANSKVTINGFWDNQPDHCLSFENPCLTLNEIEIGKFITENKNFDKPFIFAFVGRLDSEKGVDQIIEALKIISFDLIDKVHFIGDSEKLEFYKNETLFLKDKVIFHGFLDKLKVHEILKQTHFLLLPSKSEGFPKVIAESCCYGAIPIVSNVGSISHYVNDSNGFIWNINSNENFSVTFQKAIDSSSISLKEKSIAGIELAKKFTFVNYVQKLKQILEPSKLI